MAKRTSYVSETYHNIIESVDVISEKIQTFCDEQKISKEQKTRTRLAAEECLLNWRDALGNETEISLEMGRRFGRPYVKINAISGVSVNPYAKEVEEKGDFASKVLTNLGLKPIYTYKNGRNEIKFNLEKKKKDPLKQLLLVIVVALLFGIITKTVLSPELIENLMEKIINPVCDKFFSVLGAVSGPMIFLSVAWGMYGIGDTATLNTIGKKLILRYLCIVALITLLTTSLYPLLGPALSATSDMSGGGGGIWFLLNIIPDNIISPFLDGNTLQIILMGFVVGLVLLYLEKQTAAIATAIGQINYMVQFMIEFISKLIPYFIFIVLVQLIWSGSYTILADIWKFTLVTIPAFFVMVMIFMIYLSVKHKVDLRILMKKSLPTFLIALSTASSAASFGNIMDCCTKKYGVDYAVSNFGVPLGFALFKPTTSIYYLLISFYFADAYDVKTSVLWIVTAVFLTIILSMATPPIPGGSTAAYTMLFTHLGIPMEALAIALAVDIIFDFMMTAGDMVMLPNCLMDYAAGVGKIDKAKLAEPEE